ncbi:MAG: hypothetical protein V1888_02670 [archaeon]
MRSVINKRGQQALGMSFGMIFAIFLILVFIVIAFIAVGYFLNLGESAGVGLFYNELQSAVDGAMSGQEIDRNFVINLPSDIESICFANLSATITKPGAEYDAIRDYEVYDANTFLVPPEKAQGMQWKLIDRINITKITSIKNPYCVSTNDDLRIVKGFYDRLVCFGENCGI